MTLTEAIALLDTLIALPDAEGVKRKIIQIAQAAGLPAEGFQSGDPSERWLEIAAQAMVDWGWTPQQAVRGFFFALNTDPGDVDDFGVPDPSPDQDVPRPGFLSAQGVAWWNTERRKQLFATAFVTVQNTSASASLPFTAAALTFEASGESRTDDGKPTYVTTPDASIYAGIGGTLVLAAGATSAPLPVIAVQIGTYGSTAAAFSGPGVGIDVCNTQSYVVGAGAFVVTSATKATGSEREERLPYIDRCQLEGDGLAPGGPQRAYLRAMNTARDGKPLQRHDGTGPVTITAAYVSTDSATGETTGYFAGASGAVDAVDVDTANANIIGLALGTLTDPSGVLPDGIGLLPKVYSSEALPDGTAGFDTCTNDPLKINYSVKLPRARIVATVGTYGTPWILSTVYVTGQKVQNGTKLYTCATGGTSASSGGPTGTGTGISDGSATWDYVAAAPANTTATLGIFSAIGAAVSSYLPGLGIGGQDQVAGAGVVYTVGLVVAIGGGSPGLYDPIVTIPAGSTTAVNLGHVSVAAGGGIHGTITGTMVIS